MNFFREFFSRLKAKTLETLWPRMCPSCGGRTDREERHICSACYAKFEWMESGGACKICETPIAADVSHTFSCGLCNQSKPHYDLLRSAVVYSSPIDYIIRLFKYSSRTFLADELSEILEGAVRAKFDYSRIDSVIPVPLHKERLMKRGFNQSALLAEHLARRLNRTVDCMSLARTRDTPQQARLSYGERIMNMKGAFEVVRRDFVKARTVLLVDDVATTGTTLNECAKVLKQADAAEVWCVTVARRL